MKKCESPHKPGWVSEAASRDGVGTRFPQVCKQIECIVDENWKNSTHNLSFVKFTTMTHSVKDRDIINTVVGKLRSLKTLFIFLIPKSEWHLLYV